MSASTAVKVNGLGKAYQRVGTRIRYETLRDNISKRLSRLRKPTLATAPPAQFWALRELDFNIKSGEVVGIIGRNGAGKSTLLKLLARITPPTTGRIELYGRVSALLEVGTGFHPELTGLENIYLSGTILGMRRAEIKRHLEEIIDFAGVRDFLDLPVKRYSSGMRVRLGFAVAAFLQPEILLVDEVLAVGDLKFQQKCLGKIQNVAQGGRTVVFVSHQLDAVAAICTRTLLLEDGQLAADGPTAEVLELYRNRVDRQGALKFSAGSMLKAVSVDPTVLPDRFVDVVIELKLSATPPLRQPIIGLDLRNDDHVLLMRVNNRRYHQLYDGILATGIVRIRLQRVALFPGRHFITLYLGDIHGDREILADVRSFMVDYTFAPQLDSRSNTVRAQHLQWDFLPGDAAEIE